MSIKTAILSIVRDHIKPTVRVGKVKSVNQDKMTCEIDLQTAPDVYDVRIRAAIDSVAKGVLIVPKVGSIVLVATIEDKITSAFIVLYTEVESINLTTEAELHLNGDSFGGLVKKQELEDSLNSLKQYCESMNSAIANGLTSVGASTAASGAAGSAAYQAQMAASTITIKDFESKKVKHGE